MWFSQYGPLWDGPWFLIGDRPAVVYVAGIMSLIDLPAAQLVMTDDQ